MLHLQEEVLAFGSDLSADSEAQRPLYSGARSWWVVRRPELRTSLEVGGQEHNFFVGNFICQMIYSSVKSATMNMTGGHDDT